MTIVRKEQRLTYFQLLIVFNLSNFVYIFNYIDFVPDLV